MILFAIPFIYNILQQHPALTKMIHRKAGGVRRYKVPIRVRSGEELPGIPVYEAAEDVGTDFEAVGDEEGAGGSAKDPSDSDGGSTGSDEDDVDAVDDDAGDDGVVLASDAPVNPAAAPAASSSTEGVDPFDAVTLDMSQCRALESSLWELTVLACHYNPTISSLARVFSLKWTAQRKPVEVRSPALLCVACVCV